MTINRRDFLKVGAAVSAGSLLSLSPALRNLKAQSEKPNIIVLVFDAMSARNLSVYGYPRSTTPNLEKIADRATVYHSHYSAGNFTTSGTASMLTGMYPWTHRGINLSGLVRREVVEHNIFSMLHDEYYCAAYSQNYLADVLLGQFRAGINRHLPAPTFADELAHPLIGQYFPRDPVPAYYGVDDYLFSGGIDRAGSIPSTPLFALINKIAKQNQDFNKSLPGYPYGIPNNTFYSYQHKKVYAGVRDEILELAKIQSPFFGYFHLFSPHEPYRPRKEFTDIFPEMDFPYKAPTKFSTLDIDNDHILWRRKTYDEFIADVDFEIGKLVDALDDAGVLDNTYLILTADHGELFERGEYGHVTRLLYDAVIHIPLIVISPGQTSRVDIHHPTSNIDLLPTLLHLAGREVPGELTGRALPGLGGKEESRSIFSMEAKECSAFGDFSSGITISMIRDRHKMIYYSGYPKRPETFELYDLNDDAEEMKDIAQEDTVTASRMKDELLEVFEANRRFKS